MDFFLHGNRRDKQIGDRRRIQKPHEEQVQSTVPRTVVLQRIISHLTAILQSTMYHRTPVLHSNSPFCQSGSMESTRPREKLLVLASNL